MVFSKTTWNAILALLPDVFALLPDILVSRGCKAAGVSLDSQCTLESFLTAAREKAMHKFTLQSRVRPSDLLKDAASIDEKTLTNQFCNVRSVCGKENIYGYWSNADAHKSWSEVVGRVFGEYDANRDGQLTLEEIERAAGSTDGKLSLASLDPGTGSVFSVGNLWNGFIASLVLFFIYSIVLQVALQTQQTYDSDELSALEKKFIAEAASAADAVPAPRTSSKKGKDKKE